MRVLCTKAAVVLGFILMQLPILPLKRIVGRVSLMFKYERSVFTSTNHILTLKGLLVSNWRLVHATNVTRSPFSHLRRDGSTRYYFLIPDNVFDRPIYNCNTSFYFHCLTSVRNVRLRSTECPGCATTGTRNEAFSILFISR